MAAPPPAAVATRPAAEPGQLTALGPVLRLSEALLADRAVTVRGSPAGRLAGVLLFLLGLGLVALDRRSVFLGGSTTAVAGIPLLLLAAALALAGALVIGLSFLIPSKRRLAVRLAATQADEWQKIQDQARRLRTGTQAGVAVAALGLGLAAATYAVAPPGARATLVAGFGLAVALVALVLAGAAQVRQGLARRLYVQTLVLSGLERTGLGATDARVAPVLLALDELLGALPADKVQQFLASPQAQAYLDLVDEAGRTHGK